MPQPPQLFGSLLISEHACIEPTPQTVWPVGHSHALFTHVAPDAQAAPHWPQLLSSFSLLTHAPASPQWLSVPTQRQKPPWQASSAAQAIPQPPQLAGSFIV